MKRLTSAMAIALSVGLTPTGGNAGFLESIWAVVKHTPAAVLLTHSPAVIFMGGETLEAEEALVRSTLGDGAANGYTTVRVAANRVVRVGTASSKLLLSVDKVAATGELIAAELRDAKVYYKGRSRPIPKEIYGYLSCHFDMGTLRNVRYVVDDGVLTLNGTINRIQMRKRENIANHAVVVDNIIVFARKPAINVSEGVIKFWAHEVAHTAQYTKLGIKGFARSYVTRFAALEGEADIEAERAFEKFRKNGRKAC